MSDDESSTGSRRSRLLTPAEWRRIEPLLDTLLDTPPAQRAALLAELSGGNPDLRHQLEQILTECERAHPLLDKPAAERFAALVEDDAVRVSQVVADRYRITRKLRRGGMATVYLAIDLRHGREVALKVVRAELAASVSSERFLREIEIVAGLHHPHVVPLYDSGAADGVVYYVMPYEAGQSLRERLTRDGPLPIGDAVVILRDVCDALAYAHDRGIIHRDIKPDNVLLSGRHAMVTDFGVAKALSQAVGERQDSERVDVDRTNSTTGAGVTLGTPTYMAPEQIAADPASDHRADIYAVGVMAYEILAGRPPFESADRHEVLAAHRSRAPAPLAVHRPDVPEDLAAVVMKCLNKRVADRWQTADELRSSLESLRTPGGIRTETADAPISPRSSATSQAMTLRHSRVRIASGVLVVAALLFGATRLWMLRADGGPSDPSIAILPFANLSSDPADASLAGQMTEELMATLASDGNLRVTPSTSVAAIRHGTMDVRAIADTLGVSSVIEGGFGKISSRLRLDVRLVDGRDGAIRWARTYDREFKDILSVQNEIARAVAAELGLRFETQRQLALHRTKSVAAYELYLRGRDPVLLRSQAGAWRAQGHMQQAIAADSTYAAAHASLALMYVRRARTASDPEMPGPQLLALAEATARKAIALDDSLAEAHYALARVLESQLAFTTAEQEIRRAIALDPNRSVYRRWLASVVSWSGRHADELAEARRALETDPLNPYAMMAVAGGLHGLHRDDEALAQLQPLAAIEPPLLGVSFTLAQIHAGRKQWNEAIATLGPGAKDGDPMFIGLLGYVLARAERPDDARRKLADLHAHRERTGGGAFPIAMVHVGLGDRDAAFAWLEKSIDDYSISSMVMGPSFEELHGDPRFERLRERLGVGRQK